MNIPAPGWGWRFVSASSSGIAAASGSNPKPAAGLRSSSLSPQDRAARKRRRILVVEDNAMDVFLIHDALQAVQIDADVQVISDGLSAIHFFEAADSDEHAPTPAIVLLDMNLPKKSGAEVLKQLRASFRCRETPVLIVSSSSTPRDVSALQGLAISGYFKKPTNYDDFMKLGPLVKSLLKPPSGSNG